MTNSLPSPRRGRWARWIWPVALLLALLTLAPVASARTWALPSRQGGIRLYTGLQGGTPPTTEELVAIAESSSLVVATPARVRAFQATLKKANPRITILVYENGSFSVPTDPSGMPESWFLHGASGGRVHSAPHPQNTLMYPRSLALFHAFGTTVRGWEGYVRHACLNDQTRYTAGCFLDALGPLPLRPSHDLHGVVPIDPLTGRPFSYPRYMAMTSAFASRIATRAGIHVVANGFGSGNGYFHKSTYLIDRVRGVAGEAEVWMSAGTWPENVQMLITNAFRGSGALVNYEARGGRSLGAEREFATASFLIGRGAHQFFQFSDAQHKSFQQLSPLYRMQIGRPLRSYRYLRSYFRHGLYRRYYTKGVAVVNPGGETVRFSLGRRYADVNGHVMTSVTLGPQSGIVLVRAA